MSKNKTIKDLPDYAKELHNKYFDEISSTIPFTRLQLIYGISVDDIDDDCPFK